MIPGVTRNMAPILTGRTTSRAGQRFAVDKPLDCRLSPAEEAELSRYQTWRAAGFGDADIRRMATKYAEGRV